MKLLSKPYRGDTIGSVVMTLLGGILLVYGWHVFWFLTDDAYIAFRYISNARLGYGYVWNAPPFLPVEGYTSFLWVVLLDVVWRMFGVEPPASANWISLLFSYGVLVLGVVMVMQMRWHDRLRKYRVVFAGLFVVFLTFNRTFLAWSSSGLETAMMTFFLLLWVYIFLYCSSPLLRAGLGSLTTVFLVLTRPDGLIFLAAAMCTVLFLVFAEPDRKRRWNILICGFLPFGIVLAHLVWRLSFYGEWFPNTYYAKVTGIWPKSGFLYMLSFVLEYGLWFAFFIIGRALFRSIPCTMRYHSGRSTPGSVFTGLRKYFQSGETRPVVIVTLLLHVGYYTFVVGGDHFEYRVYDYLLPVIFLTLIWSLNTLRMHRLPAIAVTLTVILLSMPVQWTHWVLTKDITTREETHVMRVPVAPEWPRVVRWYAIAFDRIQSWLIVHHVCMRHQEHKVFWKTQVRHNGSREQGQKITREGYPVFASGNVGVPSWIMPHVYIIDELGLNDYIIARTPVNKTRTRLMAHSRHAPAGYVESFYPNVIVVGQQPFTCKRFPHIHPEVTGEYIISNERYWRERLKEIKKSNSVNNR